MTIEQSISINSTPEKIFAIYKDINSWAQWDPDIEAVGMDGDFKAGTTGWIKPVGAPKTRTQLVSVDEPASFVVESKLPFCAIRFEHVLKPIDSSSTTAHDITTHDIVTHDIATHTTATHRVMFTGLLAPVFSRLIGGKIRKGIGGTMLGLKRYAET